MLVLTDILAFSLLLALLHQSFIADAICGDGALDNDEHWDDQHADINSPGAERLPLR